MKNRSKIIIDILIAIAISLVVNFSHLLLIVLDQDPQRVEESDTRRVEGRFARSLDGHGYLLIDHTDSAYLSQGVVNRYSLSDGDSLTAIIQNTPHTDRGHDVVRNIVRRNGYVVAPYASSAPKKFADLITQILYYFALSWVVIIVATSKYVRRRSNPTLRSILFALLFAALLYFAAPLTSPRHRGEFIFHHMINGRPIFDFMIVLKFSFAVIVAMLYSQIYALLSQRQNMVLENEQLRSESINAQYNMLMSQINPHVLFNSLNSLSMLVREGDQQRSLTYIDHLAYTFRYILQNRESTLTTLSDELRFVEAYIYLFKIRYADKLFFDIEIDPKYESYQIPALSLQPLLDNAVKHNTILSSRPFHISITVEGDVLSVANDKYPKLDAEPSTGVGLENLRRRWELIANKPIEVVQDDKRFVVHLPLIKPAE